jgi:hypothetical protein
MLEPQNPSEFYSMVISRLDESGMTVFGGAIRENALIVQALDEIMAQIIKAYLDHKTPKACQTIVGQMFVEFIQSESGA